jgi:hypothetical protein
MYIVIKFTKFFCFVNQVLINETKNSIASFELKRWDGLEM